MSTRGRPPMPKSAHRTAVIRFRVTAAELALMSRAAEIDARHVSDAVAARGLAVKSPTWSAAEWARAIVLGEARRKNET